jgi:hypothetical protein
MSCKSDSSTSGKCTQITVADSGIAKFRSSEMANSSLVLIATRLFRDTMLSIVLLQSTSNSPPHALVQSSKDATQDIVKPTCAGYVRTTSISNRARSCSSVSLTCSVTERLGDTRPASTSLKNTASTALLGNSRSSRSSARTASHSFVYVS